MLHEQLSRGGGTEHAHDNQLYCREVSNSSHRISRSLSRSLLSVALGSSLARLLLSRGCIIICAVVDVKWGGESQGRYHAGLRIPLPPQKGRLCLGTLAVCSAQTCDRLLSSNKLAAALATGSSSG